MKVVYMRRRKRRGFLWGNMGVAYVWTKELQGHVIDSETREGNIQVGR